MRRIIINGAVFMFMARGEKLKKSDHFSCNKEPDDRYVLWPRGQGWDVRYLVFGSSGVEWLQIADNIFADEPEAWQAAFSHWMEICTRRDKMMGNSGADNHHSVFDSCDTFATLGFDNEKATF